MPKQQMIDQISTKLNSIGVKHILATDADIVIDCEFLNAGWSTGKKKITYEATVFFNEDSKTVLMWELSKEQGHGFSFGGESESSFQSGKTLFRKVKSIQYGPDGKALEYTLDLGEIPKIVKDAAKAYGWKFKTVLSRNKATYPVGYIPINKTQEPQGQPNESHHDSERLQSNLPTQPVQTEIVPKSNFGILAWIGFGLLALFTAVLFAFSHTSITGWVLAVLIFFLAFRLLKKYETKGCLSGIMIWAGTIILLFLVFAFTTNTSGSSPVSNPTNNVQIPVSEQFAVSLPYEKEFTLDDGKSIGKFRLYIDSEYGDGQPAMEFSVKFDTTTLPKEFKYRDNQATALDSLGTPALDGLVMVIAATDQNTEPYHVSSLTYGTAFQAENGEIKPIVETEATTYRVDSASIKENAAVYTDMQVLWYNINEVGRTKLDENTHTTNTEKAYGLHPPLAQGKIPWEKILGDLGI